MGPRLRGDDLKKGVAPLLCVFLTPNSRYLAFVWIGAVFLGSGAVCRAPFVSRFARVCEGRNPEPCFGNSVTARMGPRLRGDDLKKGV